MINKLGRKTKQKKQLFLPPSFSQPFARFLNTMLDIRVVK